MAGENFHKINDRARALRRQSAVKQMSTLDDLTHCFIDTPEIRAHFMEKHGQFYVDGVRYTK